MYYTYGLIVDEFAIYIINVLQLSHDDFAKFKFLIRRI